MLKVIEIEPKLELRQLLRDFEDRGGVLEFAFFRPEGSIDADALHRNAAIQFLDQCATSYFARAASIDFDAYPLAKLYEYKWDAAALHGKRITFKTFWGTDMSLDVYVMPMWRFKAGDVETAVQQLFGGQSKVITPQGIFSPQRIKGFFARRKAKLQVRQIVAEAEKELNTIIEWQDEGDVVHSQQASWGFEALRAYAKWLDLQDHLPTFDDSPEDNFYKHPAMAWDGQSREFRFSHIIDHSCHSGYYVPCRFDRVVFVEPFQSFGTFTFYHSFGSSYALADQLRALEPHIPSDNDSSISESARELIAAGFETLTKLAAKSLEHKLPIVFLG